MENQVPPSQQFENNPIPGGYSPEVIAELKRQAKEMAIQQAIQQKLAQEAQVQQQYQKKPQVFKQEQNLQPQVKSKRSVTWAEIILLFVVCFFTVNGLYSSWNYVSNFLPEIEIKLKK